jgi:Ca2+-binding RTX toxin-like protein
MANVNFNNQTTGFIQWFDEFTGGNQGKGADYLNLDTESGSAVTVQGKGFAYDASTGLPIYGDVDSVKVIYAGNAADGPADLSITNLDVDLTAFTQVLAATTAQERTKAFWSAVLSGNDTINFGTGASAADLTFLFGGDGRGALPNAVGGNDKLRGDIGDGIAAGDFYYVADDITVFGGNDDIRLVNGHDSLTVGDFVTAGYKARAFAGNDYIKLGDQLAEADGDVTTLYGFLQAGNDTLFGGAGENELVGDVEFAADSASFRSGHDEIHGGAGDDKIYGDYGQTQTMSFIGGNDKLFGDAGSDYIEGQEGNDTHDGGSGNDTINGGKGNDMLRGGTGKDLIAGREGVDTVDYRDKATKVEVALDANGMANVKVNGVIEDVLEDIENVVGGTAGDKISGYVADGDNRFNGAGGNDSLSGGGGRDTLIGGAGSDRLTGGIEADKFVFDAALGSTNVDTITDFAHGTDDIVLENAIFKALGSSVTASEFVARSSGHAATNASQHIIYDKSNGTLWYDADGSGFKAAVQFAQLGTPASHPANLTWDDFAIV